MEKTLLLVMISLIILSTFCTVKTNVEAKETYEWPMFHRDTTHTGYTSESIGPAFEVAWTFETGEWVESSPAVVGGRVFFGSNDGQMYALNATDGKHLWNYTTGGPVRSSPAVQGDYVVFGSSDSNVYAIDKTTGELIWFNSTGGIIWGSPMIIDGMVYIGSGDGYLYALRLDSGNLVWKVELGDSVWSSPAIDGEYIFVCNMQPHTSGYVHALNRSKNGEEVWSKFVNWTWSSPTVANGRVFIGTFDNGTYALNETTGEILWKTEPVYDSGSTPAYFDGRLYMGVGGYRVFSFDEIDGSVVWTFHAHAGFSSSPAITPDYLVIGNWDGNIFVLNRTTGEQIWNYTTGARIDSSPAISNGRIYIGSQDQKLYCIRGLPPTVTSKVEIEPDTLNSRSRGKWITCYIELPENYNVSDIDVSTVRLNNSVSAVLHPTEIGDYDNDDISDLMVKFDRASVIDLLSVGKPTLTITGEVDGTPFEGTDTIKVIAPPKHARTKLG